MLYLSLEDTEWPWVALVCMQTVVLMPVGIAPRRKIYVEIAPPSLIDHTLHAVARECHQKKLKAVRFLKKDVDSMVKRLFEENDDCYSFLSHMTS